MGNSKAKLFISYVLSTLFCVVNGIATYAQNQALDGMVERIYPRLEKLYKYLHQNPELSLQEKETSSRMSLELKNAGYEVTEGIGHYGVVGVLKNGEGPTLMIRTDMDALPMEEKTGSPFASRKKGVQADGKETYVMHACGHDLHMTVFIGTAQILAELKDYWKGTLLMVAQPSEENGLGAYHMIKDGLFERFPRPDFAIALHDDPHLPAGSVGYKKGALMAGVDMMTIQIKGLGGHGAAPHTTIDPIIISAQLILSLQTIVSRNINPIDPAVITVGSIHGGSIHNIIPDEVTLQLTIRNYDLSLRAYILDRIKEISENLAKASGLPIELMPTFHLREPYTPPLINDDELTSWLVEALEPAFGADKLVQISPFMVGEDFSMYGQQDPYIPICMFTLGVGEEEKLASSTNPAKELPGLHSPFFLPDFRNGIPTGVEAMTRFALFIFKKHMSDE